jgi:hypothetical protein
MAVGISSPLKPTEPRKKRCREEGEEEEKCCSRLE